MQVFFSKEYGSIEYDEVNRILIARWLMPLVSAEVRESANAIISAIGDSRTGKVVWDVIQSGTLLPEDRQWMATHWYKKAGAAGYSCGAYVLPAEYFSKMSFEDMLHKV